MNRRALLRDTWLQAVLVAFIALVATHLSGAWFLRVDLTRDGRHTLSDVAVEAVTDLDRPLQVDLYMSSGLKAPYHDHERAAKDLLAELTVASGGQLRVTAHDPTGDQTLSAEARRSGIRPIPYVYRDVGQKEAREIFMGAALAHGTQTVAVPALTSLATLERDLVQGILAVTTPEDDRSRIGWLVGHGEPDPFTRSANDPLSAVVAEMQTRGEVRLVQLDEAGVPPDLDALVIVSPTQPIPESHLVHIDQFVMGGGAIGAFVSSVRPGFLVEGGSSYRLVQISHGLRTLFGPWGIDIGRAPVLDRANNEVMAMPVGGRFAQINTPYALVTDRFGRDYEPVRFLSRAVAPFTTAVRLTQEGEVWLSTLPTSVESPNQQQLRPDAVAVPLSDETPGPHPIAVARAGVFPSAIDTVPPDLTELYPEPLTESAPTRMVVVGSGDFAVNNGQFLANTIDWLVEDPRLIEVRARVSGLPTLDPPPRLWAWKLGMVGGPLGILLLVGGLIRWRRR